MFEWPILATFAIYMWWNLLHGQDGRRRKPTVPTIGPDGRPRTPSAGAAAHPDAASAATASDRLGDPDATAAPEVDPDLVAWQEYVRGMEAEERRQAGAD